MAYSIRSLTDLSNEARGFFTQTIPGAIASVWANTFTVIGKVIALVNFEHELRRRWLFAQLFASTADDLWLQRHGFELGLTRIPASGAYGTVTLAATPGTVVPGGLTFARGDGATYTTISGGVASGNSISLTIEADLAGAAFNVAAGETLTLDAASVVAGLSSTATVEAPGLTGGADIEPIETFRARVLARKRKPPQGGSAPDYEEWAREALSTVLAVYVDSFVNDVRSVWLQFTVSDQPNGIPTPGQVAIVQAYVDDPVRRPVTARVFVSAPIPSPVAILIGGLAPDTPDIRAAVAAELAALFTDRARPSKPSSFFVLSYSWLDEAISRATGEDSHRLVTPAGDLTFDPGVMPVLGTVSYTSS